MREAKPEWKDVPEIIKTELAHIIGSPIVSADIKWGGYAPNATFVAKTADNRDIFIKGSGPWNDDTGRKLLDKEQALYASGVLDASFAPRYFGNVRHDNYHFILTEYIADALPTPPWDDGKRAAVFDAFKSIHQYSKTRNDLHLKLQSKEERYDDSEEYNVVFGTSDGLEKIAHVFECPAEAIAWYRKYQNDFTRFDTYLKTYTEHLGLGHVDCRSDNIVINSYGAKLVDWAWAAHTPLAFDVIYFLQVMECEGGGDSRETLLAFTKQTGIEFESDAVRAYLGMYALSYAAWAAGEFVPTMPRLRLSQASFLESFLNRLANEMGWDAPPAVNHKRVQPPKP